MLEAIKKLTFVLWDDETSGVTFKITGSFGFKQTGQKFIYDPQAKKEKVLSWINPSTNTTAICVSLKGVTESMTFTTTNTKTVH